MSDSQFPIKELDPVAAAQWALLGRHALTLGGGALAAFGISLPSWLSSLTDPQINIIISAMMFFGGGAMAVVGVLKSRWDKWRTHVVLVASAKASADLGVPVTVTETPKGQDNIAVNIPRDEIAAALSVPLDVAPSPAPRGT